MRLRIPPLRDVERPQIVDEMGNARVFSTENLFADGQGVLVERFRLRKAALHLVEKSRSLSTNVTSDVLRAQHRRGNAQRALVGGLGVGEAPGRLQQAGVAGEDGRMLPRLFAKLLPYGLGQLFGKWQGFAELAALLQLVNALPKRIQVVRRLACATATGRQQSKIIARRRITLAIKDSNHVGCILR